jgi:hypothetical protein
MKVLFDTSIVDQIIVGRVFPHIYAFSTPDAPNSLKVGDTYRLVVKRIEEWKKHYQDINQEYEHSAKLDDERIFRDFEVHKFLINEKNREQLKPEDIDGKYYSREFFKNATIQDLNDAIEDIKKSASNNDGKYKFYTSERLPETFTYQRGIIDYDLRPNQQETVLKFREALAKGYSNLLMYAVMRFGKSFTAMCCAIDFDFDAKIVVVLSAKADVETEWKQTIETHKKFIDFDFLNKTNLDSNNLIISEKINNGRKIVVFLTLQDLAGKDIKKRHKELFTNHVDLLIIDETHFGARAPEYGKVLKNIGLKREEIELELEDNEITLDDAAHVLKDFNPRVTLHLSGTPYRILLGDEFTEDQIIAFYQFVDIVEEQKKWDEKYLPTGEKKEWENPYYGFPQMVRFAFNPNESSRAKMKELRDGGKTNALSHLFRTKSIRKSSDNSHKEFKFEKEILELFQVIDGFKSENGILGFLNYDKINEGKLCRHIVCVLPFKSSCDALEKLIKDNIASFINLKDFEIINISGLDSYKEYPSIKNIKQKIQNCEELNKKTITLTVNRMLTGTTVQEWDTMFYFKDTASPQEYDQSIFRLQNQFVKTFKDPDNNEFTKVNMKPQTLLVDFDPDRMFQMQIQKSLFYNINTDKKGNEILEERLAKELEISPIICANQDKLVQITPTNIIDAVRNYSQNKSIIDEASDVPYDSLLLENSEIWALINSIQPIDAKKGLEIKPAEDEGSEFEFQDNDTKNDSENTSTTSENSEADTQSKDADDIKIIEKKLAAYRLRILFYSFLTKSKISTLKNVIQSLENDENKRILKNVGLFAKDLVLIEKLSSPIILSQFEWKIKNINDLGHDTSLESVERAKRALKKFARVSDSEIVMPLNVAMDLVEFLPKNEISENTKFLDLASKQGELAIAIYDKFYKTNPNIINNIYSITTSTLAYELTKKVYESLNLPIENILNFNSFELIGPDKSKYIEIIKKLNIDVILAGPPFHKKDGGGRADSGSGSAIYHEFYNLAIDLKPKFISMLMKASWYSGGKGVGIEEFRLNFISDKRIAILHDYPDPEQYFESPVSLRGGICTFLWDSNHNDDCKIYNHINNKLFFKTRQLKTKDINILIRYNVGVEILEKVLQLKENSIYEGAFSRNVFNLASNDKNVVSKPNVGLLKVYLVKGKSGFIDKKNIPNYSKLLKTINKWKVLVAKASPGFDELPHSIISEPIISEPSSLCTDSHLLVRECESELEAENFKIYMKTKFFRFLMLLAKNNHNMNKEIFRFIPNVNLNKKWKDTELYQKYNLDHSQIQFIESVVKEKN